jgi:hypothetical protein
VAVTDPGLTRLIEAITAGDEATAAQLLAERPALAQARMQKGATRAEATNYWLDQIDHYVYAGDTALHVAAAAHATDVVSVLVLAGGDVAAANRRGAQPLHYAVDGGPNGRHWDPDAQAKTIRRLLEAGADPNGVDRDDVTPLHRAIRNRCAAAVDVLLSHGADARRPNGRGSTPWQLANWTTGKSGSGSAAAKEQQAQILRILEANGVAAD